MKRFWAAAVLLALLLSLSLLHGQIIHAFTEQLTLRLTHARELAQEGYWEQAEDLTAQVFFQWQDRHFYLHSTMRHADTDEILRKFRAVSQHLELRDPEQYAAANTDLIQLLQLLAEMEQPSLVNIL